MAVARKPVGKTTKVEPKLTEPRGAWMLQSQENPEKPAYRNLKGDTMIFSDQGAANGFILAQELGNYTPVPVSPTVA